MTTESVQYVGSMRGATSRAKVTAGDRSWTVAAAFAVPDEYIVARCHRYSTVRIEDEAGTHIWEPTARKYRRRITLGDYKTSVTLYHERTQ